MIIQKDTTWSTGDVVELTSRIEIPSGVTLTIEPGVTIKGDNNDFLVGGNLLAKGTESEPINFFNTNFHFVHGYIVNPANIEFEYVKYFSGGFLTPNGEIGSGTLNIKNSEFHDTKGFYDTGLKSTNLYAMLNL